MKSQSIGKMPRTSTVHVLPLVGKISMRPNGKMPLSAHETAGRLLKEILAATSHKLRIYRLVDAVRCTLENRAAVEYPDLKALPQDEFFHLYYYLPQATFQRHISAEQRARYIANLREVGEIVVAHSWDPESLRLLLKKLDDTVKALNAWL